MAFKVLVGCDPELFVRDKRSGLIVSAHDKLPGTKTAPHKVSAGAVQVDGVAAEFNIDPASSVSQFVSNISEVMGHLQDFVGSDFELVSEPVAEFSETYFKSLPEDTRELGCNPDFDAWSGQVNKKPDGDVTFRTAAGHIHIGWTENVDPTDSVHYEDCRVIAKQLDAYLGMYSLQWDSDTKRRELYGRAGAFRPKPYGMEYRPLSNVWLRSQRLQEWVYRSAVKAVIDLVVHGTCVEDTLGDVPQRYINDSVRWWDKKTAYDEGTPESKKVFQLYNYTGLDNPPPLPKPVVPGEKPKRVRAKANHLYKPAGAGKFTITGLDSGWNSFGTPVTAEQIQVATQPNMVIMDEVGMLSADDF